MMPVPESRATLLEQQKQLLSGHRRVQMFPRGHTELALPRGINRLKIHGDVFHYDKNLIKPKEIIAASNAGRENELLGLGPVSKHEAVARAMRGEHPVAVVERTPKGVEARAAGGTVHTAPDQIAAMETNKSPGNSIAIESPANVIAQRFADGGMSDLPPLPDGFSLDQSTNGALPPLPDGFKLDQPQSPASDEGALSATGRGAVQGASFGFGDELTGLQAAGGLDVAGKPLSERYSETFKHPLDTVGALAKGAYKYWTGDKEAAQNYDQAVARERQASKTAQEQHPYAYGAGEVAGSLPAMAALPELGAGRYVGVGRNLLKGAVTGGEYGALTGAGEGSGASDRMTGAVEGGASGIIGGALAGGLTDIVSSLAKPIAGAFRAWRDPEGEASKRLTSALQADQDLIASGKAEGMSPQDWVNAYSRGEPVTLADLGSSNTQALLRSSANTSPEGRAILEKTFNDRFAGQSERVADEVRGLVAGGANANKTADQLVADYDAGRAPLYKRAYQEGDKEIVSPTIERLMGSPTFTQAMKDAVSSGQDRAITEGFGAFNPGVTVDNGMIKFTRTKPNGVPQYPNLQYWDSVKKELDGVANVARRAGDTGKADVASNLATSLRNELDKAVPSYANARGFAAQYFGASNALEAGQKLAGKRVDPQVIRDAMSKMKPDEQELFREGYASDWANRVIGNMKDTADITKAMFNSPNERERALAVFGQPGTQKMQTRMTLETIMDGARKAMGNSTTARQLIEAGLAGGAITGYETNWDPWKMATAAAGAAGARKVMGQAISSGAQKLIGKVDGRTAARVAELLTSNDPGKLQQGMTMAQRNPTVAAGLKWVANNVATAAQSPVSRDAARQIFPPAQGPIPAYTDQKQQ